MQLELGIALGRSGRGDDAVAALRRAVALKPELPRAWQALGDHLSAVGDHKGAEAAYAAHLAYSVRDPQLMRAANALQANRLPEAETLLREHLRATPTDAPALRMLAETQARLGRVEDAESLLARCLELVPGFDAARHHYAMVLHRANKPLEALVEVDTLLAKDPANPGSSVAARRYASIERAPCPAVFSVWPKLSHRRAWCGYSRTSASYNTIAPS